MSTSLSGPVWYAVHAIFPDAASSALIHPRTPNSPPLTPTNTFPFTTSGAIVTDSPMLMLPTCVTHCSLPVAASSAMVRASSVLKNTLPPSTTRPRFTTSQHATPWAAFTGCGLYDHLVGRPSFVRSSAYTKFGKGVTMYIVLPATTGAASCPRVTPVEKVDTTRRFCTFLLLISVSALKRVPWKSFAGRTHSPSSANRVEVSPVVDADPVRAACATRGASLLGSPLQAAISAHVVAIAQGNRQR